MAERGRFELPDPVKGQRFSRPPQSTTLPPLRDGNRIILTPLFLESVGSGILPHPHRRKLSNRVKRTLEIQLLAILRFFPMLLVLRGVGYSVFSGNKPGIQREASAAGKARSSGARELSDVSTPF